MAEKKRKAFEALAEVRQDAEAAYEMYNRLHIIAPGDEEFDELCKTFEDDDDPHASARAEIANLVRTLTAVLSLRLLMCCARVCRRSRRGLIASTS